MAAYLLAPEALSDLQSIWDFIAADSQAAADRQIDELFSAFEKLARWPRKGHFRRDLTNRQVRFWPIGSYLIVYRDATAPLQVVAILHAARDIPALVQER